MVKTNEQIKETVISRLKELIKNIENDTTGTDYSFEKRILERNYVLPGELEQVVRFSINRTEHHQITILAEKQKHSK